MQVAQRDADTSFLALLNQHHPSALSFLRWRPAWRLRQQFLRLWFDGFEILTTTDSVTDELTNKPWSVIQIFQSHRLNNIPQGSIPHPVRSAPVQPTA